MVIKISTLILVLVASSLAWPCDGKHLGRARRSSSASSGSGSSVLTSEDGDREAAITDATTASLIPRNAAEFSDGVWFGTQSLTCVTGIDSVEGTERRRRSPSRYTLETKHRLIYYRGLVYEWGTGDNFYHIGPGPISDNCHTTWEDEPAGHSNCPATVLAKFTREYSLSFGPYNLFTNNCHNYANRIVELLGSESCMGEMSPWVERARRFWSIVGSLANGEWPEELRVEMPKIRWPHQQEEEFIDIH